MELAKRALILIDIQKGFSDFSFWGPRNNINFEKNVAQLLSLYRQLQLPVIHVQHISILTNSPLRAGQIGVEFMDCAKPAHVNEIIFKKSVNSAFIGTNLEKYLIENHINSLTMAGMTSDHCVSTSARMAANLGFKVGLIADAMATFDRKGIDGQIYPAELVHQVSLASLNEEFAKVESLKQHREVFI